MDPEHFADRLGDASSSIPSTARPARLAGWRRTFSAPSDESATAGYADIVPDTSSSVNGVVYDMGDLTLDALAAYYKDYVGSTVTLADDNVAAEVLTVRPEVIDDTRLPARPYLDALLQAGELLPPQEQDALRAWPIDDTLDPDELFNRLSPAAQAALTAADRLRRARGSTRLHVEHVVMGLFENPDAPAWRLLHDAEIQDQSALVAILDAAAMLEEARPA